MKYRRCRCPIWVVGTLRGEFLRKSLNLANWEKAQATIREWETDDSTDVETFNVEKAGERFIEDATSRHLAVETTNKYKLMFREMSDFFGHKELKHISVDDFSSYRSSWKMAPITSLKKLERLKAFLGFCKARGWVKENRAAFLKTPKAEFKPTLPFTNQEWEKILWATEVYPNKGIYGFNSGERLRSFVLMLRYTGLRISDVVKLRWFKDVTHPKPGVENDTWKVFLYTQKTGTPVWVPIPSNVGELFEKVWMKMKEPEYPFWSGRSDLKACVGDWQRSLRKLFKLGGVKDGHAHRFRDTFSVSLLQAGVPLETVSVLLGHTSIKVTERHYAPWVRSRQENLEAQVKKTWQQTK